MIFNENCLVTMKRMENESIDLVLTDPPFKISQKYTQNVDADNLLAVSSIWPAAKEWFRILKSGSYLAVYYDTRILPLAISAIGDAGFKYLRGLTFYRRWGNAHKLYGWMSTSDFILLFRKPSDEKYNFYSEDWRHDVYWKDKPEKDSVNHPAQKPISDVCHLINHLCPPDGIVYDSFMGSGTTIIAAIKQGRKYIGSELKEEYFDIAKKRIEDEIKKTNLFKRTGSERQEIEQTALFTKD